MYSSDVKSLRAVIADVRAATRRATLQLRSYRGRFLLGSIGTAVSTYVVLLVISVLAGARAYVENEIVTKLLGVSAFEVRARQPVDARADVPGDSARAGTVMPLTMDDGGEVADSLRRVAPVAWHVSWEGVPVRGDSNELVLSAIHLVGGDYLEARQLRTIDGDESIATGVVQHRAGVLIGHTLARRLYGDDSPIGKVLRTPVGRVSVAGVLAPRGGVLGEQHDMGVISTLTGPLSRLRGRSRSIDAIIVATTDDSTRAETQQRIRDILRSRRGLHGDTPDDFEYTSIEAVMRLWARIERPLLVAGTALPGIGLLVSALIVANIMLISLADRVREVGVARAVGARRRAISLQFLIEACLLNTMGSIAGIALAALSVLYIRYRYEVPMELSWRSMLGCTLLAIAMGALAGTAAVSRAARLEPTECLGRE